MNPPDIVRKIGRWTVGVYNNVVIIDYNMLYVSVMIESEHPMAQFVQMNMNMRRTLLQEIEEGGNDPNDERWGAVHEIRKSIVKDIELVLQEEDQGHLIVERGKQVIENHVNQLLKYGQIVAYDCDTIYFIPNEEYRGELEKKEYFCGNVTAPYRAVCDRFAKYLIIYGDRSYAKCDNTYKVDVCNADIINARIQIMHLLKGTKTMEDIQKEIIGIED